MKALDLIKYVPASDFLQKRLHREDQLKIASKGTKDILPAECDLETMARIYGLRARTMVEYPLVLVARITGMNYLYRRLR